MLRVAYDEQGDVMPPAVRATILAEAGDNTIREIELETEDGQTVCAAEVFIDGQETDILIAADLTLLGTEVDDEDDEGRDDHEEADEDDVQVSLGDLPGAVLATLKAEAPNGETKELEREAEDGQIQYAIAVVIEGQPFDIEIAPGSTLLQKDAEDEDED